MADIQSQLQGMVDDLREGLSVEVKNWLNGLASALDKANLAKEIIALANNDGGFVFVGFDDAAAHASIIPLPGEREAFTQDTVSGLVQAYVSPPCQCEVHFITRTGETVQHPVIVVPGGHRTPVFARRGGPGNEVIKTNDVYLRRPGGSSEAARTQDDWEKLLDRLVKARQADQLNAIREILNPQPVRLAVSGHVALDVWVTKSIDRWTQRIAPLARDDLRRHPQGYWFTAFRIDPFSVTSLHELQEFMDRRTPKYSGISPFTFLHGERSPAPIHDTIEAWLDFDMSGERSDFWRVSKGGFAFQLRPMQEDRGMYGQQAQPAPPRPTFDWILPIYRMAEVMLYMKALASEFSTENAGYDLHVGYRGTMGRRLWRVDHNYWLDTSAPCQVDSIDSAISGNVSELGFNLNEHLWKLLVSVYEQFGFEKLERALVDRVVAEVLQHRSR